MSQDFGSVNLKIFFDESGKNQTKPHLMGGLAIPESYYNSPKILALNALIRIKKFTGLHMMETVRKEILFGRSF